MPWRRRGEDNLSPRLIWYQSRRLKWGLILEGVEGLMGGRKEGAQKSSSCVFWVEERRLAVKRGTWKRAHRQTRNAQACKCTICNINVRQRVWISDWKAGASLCFTSLFLMCRDVSHSTTLYNAAYLNKQFLTAWIMQRLCFPPTHNTYLVNKLLTLVLTRCLCK